LFKFTFSAVLIALLIWKYPVSWAAMADTFRSVNVFLLPIIGLLLFNQFVLSSMKWKSILRSHDINLPLPTLVRSYMIGTFFSAFLPSSYMGDFVRIADVGRATGRSYASASAVVFERLSGLAALAAAGTIASFFISAKYNEPAFRALGILFLGIVGLLTAVFLPGVLELTRTAVRRIRVRLAQRVFDKIAGAVVHYRGRPTLLGRALFWSFTFQIMAYTIFYLYGQALNISIPYVYCFAFVPVVYLLEALPISIAGIGLREGGLIYFLGKVGYGSSEAIALSVLVLSFRYSMNLTGGLLFLLRRGETRKVRPTSEASDEEARAEPLPTPVHKRATVMQTLSRTALRRLVPGFIASVYYLLRSRCMVHPRAMVQLSGRIQIGRKTTIHPYARILLGEGRFAMGVECNLQSFSTIAVGDADVRIGNHVRIGPSCNLLGEDHEFHNREVPIHKQRRKPAGLVIGDDVFIGGNSVVLSGLEIGRGAVVGAGTVVTTNVPEFAIVVGNPARIVKYRGESTDPAQPEQDSVRPGRMAG
jgi:acetyltransferase-like isoleucine patch superfamily enzyme/uncharacterized membrane protein YbhN (UPF0104 family)